MFNKKQLVEKGFKLLIILLCSIGLLEQVRYVSHRYFEYRTKTIIGIIISGEASFPIVSICFRYHDVLNRTKFKEYYNISLIKFNEPGYQSHLIFNQTKYLTISELFDLTPSENMTLKPSMGCNIRYPERFLMDMVDTPECYKSFNIRKYLMRQNVCYMFTPKIGKGTLPIYEYALTPGYTGQMYKLHFDTETFNDIDSASVVIHSNNSSFIQDTAYASNIEMKLRYLPTTSIFHQKFMRIRLPLPYNTKCRNPPSESTSNFDHWFRLIDKKSMEALNISVSFYPTFDSTLNIRKIINYKIFYNETLRKKLLNVIKSTPKYFSTCKSTNFITRTQFFNDNGSSFAIHWTRDAKMRTIYSPEQDLLDYVVYVCSCIGIWFGLSSFSMLDTVINWLLPKNIPDNWQNQEKINVSLSRQCNLLNRKLILIKRFNEQLYNFVRS